MIREFWRKNKMPLFPKTNKKKYSRSTQQNYQWIIFWNTRIEKAPFLAVFSPVRLSNLVLQMADSQQGNNCMKYMEITQFFPLSVYAQKFWKVLSLMGYFIILSQANFKTLHCTSVFNSKWHPFVSCKLLFKESRNLKLKYLRFSTLTIVQITQ